MVAAMPSSGWRDAALQAPDPGSHFRLDGRRALVTGASRGIGRAIALTLAGAGADVGVHFHANQAAAREVSDAIQAAGRRAPLLQADLSEPSAARELARMAVAALGRVDILVLNAAEHRRHDMAAGPDRAFDVQVTSGFRSAFDLCGALVPAMAEHGFGRVIAIGSVQARRPHPKLAVYAATKAALANLMRNLGKEWARHGVTANVIAPGIIDTDRNAALRSDVAEYAAVLASIPVGRAGLVAEVAPLALLLASPAGAYITGANLPVDGGQGLP
ncbi:SDR family NAD(P)-dependent oxidoreductase [Falsiroseomonas sp. HW251]|uniref:SDR family NAD(P)-dependent oxidoreductase n=1 Tax=Falsiroseomonas sp. HW251 TaxID=3390998 RepID=UPI003D32448B